MNPGRNIIVLGETGVGKSSLINMILGDDVAPTSDGAAGCTFESKRYFDNRGNIFFDTVGLNEASRGTVTARQSINALVKLLKSLKDGINLIIFVIKKGRVTEVMQRNYMLFVSGICQNKVPVILAISGMEFVKYPERWYQENQRHFEKNGMKFVDVVSGCFARRSDNLDPSFWPHQEKSYEETKRRILQLIESGEFEEKKTFGTLYNWLKITIKNVWNWLAGFLGFSKITFLTALKESLMTIFGISEREAIDTANEIEDLTLSNEGEQESTSQ